MADDVQWFGEPAVSELIRVAGEVCVVASRRPWPIPPVVRALEDILTEHEPAVRLAPLTVDRLAPVLAQRRGAAIDTATVIEVHRQSAGWPGLAVLALDWSDRDLGVVPGWLVDAVLRHVERAGPRAVELARLLALDEALTVAQAALVLDAADHRGDGERAVRAAGILDEEDRLAPLVARAVLVDLPGVAGRHLHDRIAATLGPVDPERSRAHLLAGTGSAPGVDEALIEAARRLRRTDPAACLELLARADAAGVPAERTSAIFAEAAFWSGRAEVPMPPPGTAEATEALTLALEMRAGRWQAAAEVEVDHPSLLAVRAVAAVAAGRPLHEPGTTAGGGAHLPLERTWRGLWLMACGGSADGLRLLAEAADDHDRVGSELPLGFTPHLLGGLGALSSGDLPAAASLLEQAIAAGSADPVLARSHRLVAAYVELRRGRHGPALDELDPSAGDQGTGLNRLLRAALGAAVARRHADTARLRQAWEQAERELLRVTPSWLLLDPLTDLVVVGARLGHTARIEPVVRAAAEQAAALPAAGPASAGVAWLDLQVALAGSDVGGVDEAVEELRRSGSSDRRSRARVRAGPVWALVVRGRADEATVLEAVDSLASVGETWEATRLAGQAALDAEDPEAARRLLERARGLGVEPVGQPGGDGLVALGLSDREAEVARRVADGLTHKEIGAALFISPKTVEHHVARIRQKLGADSRAELLAAVRRHPGTAP